MENLSRVSTYPVTAGQVENQWLLLDQQRIEVAEQSVTQIWKARKSRQIQDLVSWASY
jgi:hypothetical protein